MALAANDWLQIPWHPSLGWPMGMVWVAYKRNPWLLPKLRAARQCGRATARRGGLEDTGKLSLHLELNEGVVVIKKV